MAHNQLSSWRWAWEQDGLGSSAKAVLLALAWDANMRRGVTTLPVGRIVEMTELSERSVHRMLRKLEALGKIKRAPIYRGDGSQTANRYTICR